MSGKGGTLSLATALRKLIYVSLIILISVIT